MDLPSHQLRDDSPGTLTFHERRDEQEIVLNTGNQIEERFVPRTSNKSCCEISGIWHSGLFSQVGPIGVSGRFRVHAAHERSLPPLHQCRCMSQQVRVVCSAERPRNRRTARYDDGTPEGVAEAILRMAKCSTIPAESNQPPPSSDRPDTALFGDGPEQAELIIVEVQRGSGFRPCYLSLNKRNTPSKQGAVDKTGSLWGK